MRRLLAIAASIIFLFSSCQKSSEPSIVGKWDVEEIIWIGHVIGFDTPVPLFKQTHEYTFDNDGILTESYKDSIDPNIGTKLYPYVFNGTSLILMKQEGNVVFTVRNFTDTHLTLEKGEYQYKLIRE